MTSAERTTRVATPDGTRRLAGRMVDAGRDPAAYRLLGRTGLTVSTIGFGGYRVHDNVDAHRGSLESALASGCNLIDTSTNYGDGSSERLVGEVMCEIIDDQRRDEIVVVSKVGYIQGSNLDDARLRKERGAPYPEVVEYMEGCWHCIHPEFIEDQLEASLGRLELEQVDVYLLHNPEYFLTDAEKRGDGTLEARRTAYYDRLGRAFAYLEAQVAAGRIGAYGVSSNTFVHPADAVDATSLTRLVELAREVGGPDHHFSVAQCPLNLFETGAALTLNHGADLSRTFLTEAAATGTAVLLNRPLNALSGRGMLVRIADFDTGEGPMRLDRLVKSVQLVEEEFSEGLGQVLSTGDGKASDLFRYAARVREQAGRLGDVVRWEEYINHGISPELTNLVARIDEVLDGPMKAAWQIWLEHYVDALGKLADGLRMMCARASQRRSDRIARLIAPALPEGLTNATLSQKAVAMLRGLEGVTCVLVGMRRPQYVADVMRTLDWPPFETDPAALAVVREGADA